MEDPPSGRRATADSTAKKRTNEPASRSLEYQRHADGTGRAGSYEAIAGIFSLEAMAAIGDEAGTGGAEGMAQRQRPSPGVEAGAIDLSDRAVAAQPIAAKFLIIEELQHRQHLGREGLVQLDDLDLIELEPGRVEDARYGQSRSQEELLDGIEGSHRR